MNNKRDFKGVWIPAEIWLSDKLTLQEKVFLVEISSLDNEEGCYANNAYFAEFFGISKTRVSIVINSLVEKKYITSTMFYKEGTKQILKRVLKVCYIGYQRKVKDPIQEKFKDNNTVNNTNSNTFNIEEVKQASPTPPLEDDVIDISLKTGPKEERKKVAPKKESVEDAPYYFEVTQVLAALSEKTGAKYRIPEKKSLLLRYGPYQVITARIKEGFVLGELLSVIESKCKEWLSSDKMCKYLVPATLFSKSKFESYLASASIKPNIKTHPPQQAPVHIADRELFDKLLTIKCTLQNLRIYPKHLDSLEGEEKLKAMQQILENHKNKRND